MKRRMLVLALAVMPTLALAPARADEMTDPVTVQMTAAQIEELLSGNTITGTWSGSRYTQYFAENGLTIYFPEGGRPDQGKWRTNADTEQYESWWERTNWTPYTVMITNDGYAWVNKDSLEPFEVFEGKQVVW